MSSEKSKKLEAIPLPKVVREALMDIPKGFYYVSHKATKVQLPRGKSRKARATSPQSSELFPIDFFNYDLKIPQKKELTKDIFSIPKNHLKNFLGLLEQPKDPISSTPSADVPEEKKDIIEQPVVTDAPFLTSENHRFYIGKFIPKTFGQRIGQVMGWQTQKDVDQKGAKQKEAEQTGEEEKEDPKQRIYSEEFFKDSLKYLFSNLKTGEKVQLVIGPCLSALINGSEDVKEALSADQEIELIRKIVKKYWPDKLENFVFLKMDELPEHQELFSALKNSYSAETGRSEVDQVLNQPVEQVSTPPTSLEIARLLYSAVKPDKKLFKMFLKAVPGLLRKGSREENLAKLNYGIIEVAIRLIDLLNGRYIQGGADRQALYDDIIIEIIKGKAGTMLKHTPAMKTLFKIFQTLRFETLHVDAKECPSMLQSLRNAARMRIAALGLVITTAVVGLISFGQIREQKRQQQIEENLKTDLSSKSFFSSEKEDSKRLDRENNLDRFHQIVNGVILQLKILFNIPDKEIKLIKSDLEGMILADSTKLLLLLNDNIPEQFEMALKFLKLKRRYFEEHQLKIKSTLNRYIVYAREFTNVFQEEWDISSMKEATPRNLEANIKRFDKYISFDGKSTIVVFHLAFYIDSAGKKHLIAAKQKIPLNDFIRDVGKVMNKNLPISEFSSQTAREMVCHHVRDKQLFEVLKVGSEGFNSEEIHDNLEFSEGELMENLGEILIGDEVFHLGRVLMEAEDEEENTEGKKNEKTDLSDENENKDNQKGSSLVERNTVMTQEGNEMSCIEIISKQFILGVARKEGETKFSTKHNKKIIGYFLKILIDKYNAMLYCSDMFRKNVPVCDDNK